MQVSVLGPVEIRRDGRGYELGARQQRLLAALVISDGSVVSVDRLVDIVWAGDPPESAAGTLRTYITRLRQALDVGRHDVIVFRQPGYALDLRPGELDSELFDDELGRALAHLRTADPAAALPMLQTALGRWRGDAFALFADEEWARPEAVRLEERRLEAREALVEARLGVGAVEQAVAEASGLVEAAPLRARPRLLLMRSLYVAGRQAEALRVASDYRQFLVAETGLDPSADLVELEGRIARGAPAVDGSVQVLRGYELHERVGEGAFAVVHRATQPGLQRDVAIKIIRGELADQPDFIRRFEVEAQTVARVEHSNVVPLFDFWREPGAAYLVMRLLRGGSVEQALRARGPYSREQTIRLLDEVGGALETAHRAGVVHRDVRPANLLLDDDGVTYLADFGIALPTATADDLPIVSPAYASPEVLRGEPAGPAADVLSLGVTVFELLTGRLPFADSVDRAEVIRRQLAEPLPPVRATRTDLPAGIDDVLARATAKAAGDRHGSIAALVEDLRKALTGVATPSSDRSLVATSRPVENPYVGLHAFDEQDADRYFGREALVVELVEALEQHPLVAVVGASGSGKSSAVRAGLLPAVRRGAVPGSAEWFVTTMLPGTDPVDALETALLRVAVNPPATLRAQLAQSGGLLRAIRRVLPDERTRILLVVDQFEELFTQVDDADERDRFLTELAVALTAPDSPLRVVATLRADHYDAPLRHPALAQLVTDGTVTVRPMTADELERAITLPVRDVGVDVESTLVVDLVAAVTAHPAALPLLQFSLTELFDRRTADVMLLDTHRELGGLAGAMAARADRIIDAGDSGDEAQTRRIFGRLVTLGDGVEDTRRRVLRSELGSDERTAWLVDAFVTARLFATDRDPATRAPTIEVAHEALLRDWPRLRDWLDDDRADLRTLRQVTAYANGWNASGREISELARGSRLAGAEDLAGRHVDWLNDNETDWIAASGADADADTARQVAMVDHDRRQNRRLRTLLTTAVTLLVVAVLAAAAALVLRNRAVDSTDETRAGELAGLATLAVDEDPERAILLGLAALERSDEPSAEVLSALHRATQSTRLTSRAESGMNLAMDLNRDGSLVAVDRLDRTGYQLIETSSGTTVADVTTSYLIGEQGLAFDPSGSTLAVAYEPEDPSMPAVEFYNTTSGQPVGSLLGEAFGYPQLTYHPSGRWLSALGVYGDVDWRAVVWDLAAGGTPREFGPASDFELAGDGTTVTVLNRNGVGLGVFDIATGERIRTIDTPAGVEYWDLRIDPAGKLAALTSILGRRIDVIDMETGELRKTLEFRDPEIAQFSPDGSVLAITGGDSLIRLYGTDDFIERQRLAGTSGTPFWMFFAPDGARLTSGSTGEVRTWDISPAGPPALGNFRVSGGLLDRLVVAADESAAYATVHTNFGDLSSVHRVDLRTGDDDEVLSDVRYYNSTRPLVSPDGSWVATLDDDYVSNLARLPGGDSTRLGRCESVRAFDRTARLAAVDATLLCEERGQDLAGPSRIVDLETGDTLVDLADIIIYAAAFGPPGDDGLPRSAFVEDRRGGAVTMYDLSTRDAVGTFVPDPGEWPESLAMSPDGKRLDLLMNNGRLIVLDVDRIVEGDDQADAKVVDIVAHGAGSKAIDVSNSGFIATGSSADGVRIWSRDGLLLASVPTQQVDPPTFAFAPGTDTLYYEDGDGVVRRFAIDMDDVTQLARSVLTRGFTSQECARYFPDEPCPTIDV